MLSKLAHLLRKALISIYFFSSFVILSFLSAFDSRPECLVEVCNKILAILKTNTNLSTKVTVAVKTTAGPTVSVPPSSHNCKKLQWFHNHLF